MEVKLLPGCPYEESSNLVVARSTRAGGTSSCMNSAEDTKLIQLLLARLERVSVDSYWAHRASGIRGALLKSLENLEKGIPIGQAYNNELITSAFKILIGAARKKR